MRGMSKLVESPVNHIQFAKNFEIAIVRFGFDSLENPRNVAFVDIPVESPTQNIPLL